MNEKYYQDFVQNLYRFFSDLNRYTPNETTSEFLSVFNKLDMGKMMLRFISTMRENESKLKSRDETMFDSSVEIFPGIHLDDLWKKLTDKQKNKIWTHLQILNIQSEILMNFVDKEEENEDLNKVNDLNLKKNIVTENQEVEEFKDFNPYIGVGGNGNDCSIDQLYSGYKDLPKEIEKPSIDSIINMVGIDKYIPNLKEISDKLKNMDKDDIDKATNDIKSLLGKNGDKNTTDFISNVLGNISEELKKEDISKGDAIKNIFKIAENVANKVRPSLDKQNIDMGAVFNSTKNIANQCKDENGQAIFPENMDPFTTVENIMKGNLQNMDLNKSQEEYLKQCNNMLKNMGLNFKKKN